MKRFNGLTHIDIKTLEKIKGEVITLKACPDSTPDQFIALCDLWSEHLTRMCHYSDYSMEWLYHSIRICAHCKGFMKQPSGTLLSVYALNKLFK